MFKQFWITFIAGIKLHPYRLAGSIFLAYSAIWTVFEPLLALVTDLDWGGGHYIVMLLVSIFIGTFIALRPYRIQFNIKATDTDISIGFGDLFAANGYKVISVNDFFDSNVGKNVSQNSLHGQLINRYFSGHSEPFESLVDASLKGKEFTEKPRDDGRRKRYAIGTTAIIPICNEKFYLVALSHTDLDTSKTSAEVIDLWLALESLWQCVRNTADGHTVSIALMGSGLSKIGLPPAQLLEIMLLSILVESKKQRLGAGINIVLDEKFLDDIDLGLIKKLWI